MESHADNRSKGNIGENIACKYLINRGFVIEMRNYRKKWGELDIIALKDDRIHFFEVKSVTGDFHRPDFVAYRPEDNVHAFKLGQIRRMIQTYFSEFKAGEEIDFHFHVLCVFMDMQRRVARINWLRDIIM